MAQVFLLLCGTGDSHVQLPTLSQTSVRLGKADQGTAGDLLNQLPLCLCNSDCRKAETLFLLNTVFQPHWLEAALEPTLPGRISKCLQSHTFCLNKCYREFGSACAVGNSSFHPKLSR